MDQHDVCVVVARGDKRVAEREKAGCGKPAAVAAAKKAFAKLEAEVALSKDWKRAEKTRSKTQKDYDKQTCHGLDQERQAEWTGKF